MTGAAPGNKKSNAKRSYAKPAMRRVYLRPEEAVLGGCKTASTSGPVHPQCTTPTPCAAVAS
jgi:hypothetical protein